jgi:hypothetical protein
MEAVVFASFTLGGEYHEKVSRYGRPVRAVNLGNRVLLELLFLVQGFSKQGR